MGTRGSEFRGRISGTPGKRRLKPAESKRYWTWSFGKRPAEELYEIGKDPDCLDNLAGRSEFQQRQAALKEQLFQELRTQGDPRMFGQGHVFDEYPYADGTTAHFYERYQKGKLDKKAAGWVNPSDFEDAVP